MPIDPFNQISQDQIAQFDAERHECVFECLRGGDRAGALKLAQQHLDTFIGARTKPSTSHQVYLEAAAEFNDVGLAQLAGRYMANPNHRSNNDGPVLHIAARHGSTEVCKYLLSAGADISATHHASNHRLNALDAAVLNGKNDTAVLLSVHGGVMSIDGKRLAMRRMSAHPSGLVLSV